MRPNCRFRLSGAGLRDAEGFKLRARKQNGRKIGGSRGMVFQFLSWHLCVNALVGFGGMFQHILLTRAVDSEQDQRPLLECLSTGR